MTKVLFLFLVFADCSLSLAENTKLKVPRFATIKSNEVNARIGPAINCPIEWVFIKKGEPVEITAEYEQWRLIRDIKGEGGWVHLSVLSGKRSIIIVSKDLVALYKLLGDKTQIVAKVHQDVRCQLIKCKDAWCLVKCQGHEGWTERKFLWGVYPDEKL